MTTVSSGGCEFSKFVAYHILCYVYRNVLLAVVNSNCVSNEFREYGRGS